jgi:protein tyrosine phosphatase
MIAEKEIHQIVMVTELKEQNKEKEFAYPYWPQEINQTLELDNQKVTCIEHTCQFPDSHQFIEIRKFKLEGPLGQRIVTHYWYRNWLDDTAPCQHAILNLLNTVSSETQGHPILVHCSAGIGRTGVFLTLYHLLHAKNSAFKNLFTFIAYLRWQRPYSVAVYPQYEFCYAMNEKLGC